MSLKIYKKNSKKKITKKFHLLIKKKNNFLNKLKIQNFYYQQKNNEFNKKIKNIFKSNGNIIS